MPHNWYQNPGERSEASVYLLASPVQCMPSEAAVKRSAIYSVLGATCERLLQGRGGQQVAAAPQLCLHRPQHQLHRLQSRASAPWSCSRWQTALVRDRLALEDPRVISAFCSAYGYGRARMLDPSAFCPRQGDQVMNWVN